ncbi:hypothetical protein AB6A40_007159 [Gnathostoma spinigerum]|uniref:Uncharacterized protein n=1 Tax=Gnathostoma spinigerum TaxID=75299 RepID=A0ABD6EKE6_9BILA
MRASKTVEYPEDSTLLKPLQQDKPSEDIVSEVQTAKLLSDAMRTFKRRKYLRRVSSTQIHPRFLPNPSEYSDQKHIVRQRNAELQRLPARNVKLISSLKSGSNSGKFDRQC